MTGTGRTTHGGAAPRPAPDIPMKALWFGMLGGIIAWAVGFMASYPVAAACGSGARLVAVLVTAATMATAAAAVLVAWWNWQKARDSAEPGSGGRAGRATFMSFSGMILSGGALVLTAAHAIPILVLPPCVVM